MTSLFIKVTATNSFSHDVENFSLRRAVQKKNTQVCSQYYLMTDTKLLVCKL